jgi:hypothetical protein
VYGEGIVESIVLQRERLVEGRDFVDYGEDADKDPAGDCN